MVDSKALAVVDLGSNSFHMMVARIDGEHIKVIDRLREPVRLRMGMRDDGTLTKEAQERALTCLNRFAQRLRGVKNVRVVGTNTLRRARDASDFISSIEDILQARVDVIGGMEEARLIYLGVAHYLSKSDERNMVIDIGGGSTEFIIGQNKEILMRESLSMGCVSFAMDFFKGGILNRKRFKQAVLAVGQHLESLQHSLSEDHWDRCVGASGTIKAIGSVLEGMGHGEGIQAEALDQLVESLPWGRALEKADLPNLRDDRLPVFAGGLAVLCGIFHTLGIHHMQVSPHSMREGLLLDSLGRVRNRDVRSDTVAHLSERYAVDRAQAARVKTTVMQLFPQIMGKVFGRRGQLRRLLGWAAELHEIGRAIAHTGYHKHGAYIIANGDMDGFSRVEQSQVAFLVLNHRKRLKTDPLPYKMQYEWHLVFIMRLGFILNRERIDLEIPDIAVEWFKKQIELQIDPTWLADRPMTKLDIQQEQRYWKRIGYSLLLNGRR